MSADKPRKNAHDHSDTTPANADPEAPENTPRVDASQIQAHQKPPQEGRRRSESASRGSTSGTSQETGEDHGGGTATAVAEKPATNGTNRVGLTREGYKGAPTTLCAGCGHNAITNHIIRAFFEYGVEPYRLAKMSGIGCSSKAPAYFVSQAHGFNSVHGRMPSVATGAKLADRELVAIGVSGDGDTASIGVGQFIHMIRRNLNMVYICENNGVYGLTKGQFSATSEIGSRAKTGKTNEFESIDIAGLAIELGCTFVARSFSGDGKQVVPLIEAALAHRGTAVLDIISPCVTFNDHEGSTKSYKYVKEHDIALQELDFIPYFENIEADYAEGTSTDITLHDGSHMLLRKLASGEHDVHSRIEAQKVISGARDRGEILTGLLYIDEGRPDLGTVENLPATPLRELGELDLRPTREAFEALMQEYA
ncbi:MAG: 2-oxoglutarate/2-oxoacid ferredoxin oxidoreductase subunit beta [Chloroflexota bacterium]|jgi:2-oxoglutarate ferredoxin oxidoreductase subunit beta|nr:2-oxoglutarate/2-oxoacid ferredoxin oxidoreductase subunit beta [Chloroflexota bacterium]